MKSAVNCHLRQFASSADNCICIQLSHEHNMRHGHLLEGCSSASGENVAMSGTPDRPAKMKRNRNSVHRSRRLTQIKQKGVRRSTSHILFDFGNSFSNSGSPHGGARSMSCFV